MSTNVRLLSPQGDDRQVLMAFYLAHIEGHRRQRSGLSLDPRCIHIGACAPDGELLAVVQMLPVRLLDGGDHWRAFFESHTVPGIASRQLLLFQPTAVGGPAGRQALAELLDEVVALADREDLDALLLAAAPEDVDAFAKLGFAVYTNGRRSTGTGFIVPMVHLRAATVAGAGHGEAAGAARAWLAKIEARRPHFIVRDISGSHGGLLSRFGLKSAR